MYNVKKDSNQDYDTPNQYDPAVNSQNSYSESSVTQNPYSESSATQSPYSESPVTQNPYLGNSDAENFSAFTSNMPSDYHPHFYKLSGKFSILGMILTILFSSISGALIFTLYILLDAHVSFVKLLIIFALFAGCGIGFVNLFFVRLFKIRNKTIAIICIVISFFIASYFKWGFYDYLDLNSTYKNAKEINQTADEYFGISDSLDTNYASIEDYFNKYTTTNAYDFMEQYASSNNSSIDSLDLSESQIKESHNCSFWEFLDYDSLLGTDIDTVKKSVEASKTMYVYEFLYKYRKIYHKPDIFYNMTHPSAVWSDIKKINLEGRWSFSSSYSSYSSYSSSNSSSDSNNNSKTKGIWLWIVWGSEFVIMLITAILPVNCLNNIPFLEEEGAWAKISGQSKNFVFYVNTDISTLKSAIMLNPYTLLSLRAPDSCKISPYITIQLYNGHYMTENYITVIYHHDVKTNNKKTQHVADKIISLMAVDGAFVHALNTSQPVTISQSQI